MTRATVQTATLTMAQFSSVGDSSHMGMHITTDEQLRNDPR